jgi:hypothetical protein
VFHDSSAGDATAQSTKKKMKNANQQEYLCQLAGSSVRKSIAVSKVCDLETEKNMESMLYTACDQKCCLQKDLADDYKDEGGRTHVKQLKADFKSFKDATKKVEVARKRIEEWKARKEANCVVE